MTPEETKEYIDHRLQELGLQLQLDGPAYEKIYRFTNGTEAGANKVCFKVLSLCSDDDTRKISGDTLSTAIDELVRVEELMKRSAKSSSRKANDEIDRVSIEQLAAVLEANADSADTLADTAPAAVATAPARPTTRAKPAPGNGHRPKVLIVNESQTRRAILVNVLSNNFTCVETADTERAWKVLTEQRDIDVIIIGLPGHHRAVYDFIARTRSAASPHLVGIPIVAVATTDDANAKQRAITAGANDVIPLSSDAGELEARVYARYRSIRAERPTAKPAKIKAPEPRVVPSTSARNGFASRQPAPVLPKPGVSAKRSVDPSRFETASRPFTPPPRAGLDTPVPDLVRRLHQISSTTSITLSATVLVIVALTIILYVNRMESHETTVAPPVAQANRVEQPDPAPTPEPKDEIRPSPPAEAPPIAEDRVNVAPERGADAKPAERDTAPIVRSDPPPAVPAPTDPRPAVEPPVVARSTPPPAPADVAVQPRPSAPVDSAPANPLPAPESEANVAAQTPAKPALDGKLTEDDLSTLLKRLVFVYEAGDIEQFMNLFAPNARTNDRTNRSGIREDYENLFRTTDLRLMKVSYVNWEVENNRAQGWGNFEVSVRRAGERETHDYQGSITLYVERMDGRLRIVRLYHGQRRAGK